MRIAIPLMAAVAAVVLGTATSAQEGSVVVPSNYKVTFENAWVKVTSVRYEPRQRLAPHTHTPNAAAYVYLNDGPPVIFQHVGGKAATRPATKAGTFRVYRGLDEVHEVENTGDAPSEFLRIELKTATADQGMFWGKQDRPAAPSTEPVVQFNHAQLRISRLWVLPAQEVQWTAATEPALVVALGAGTALKPGETRWLDAASSVRLKNTAAAPVDLLRFDLRTRPRETR
jgi:hypothetical protein